MPWYEWMNTRTGKILLTIAVVLAFASRTEYK